LKKLALVTGGTSGIGFTVSEQFARRGYNLVLVYHSKSEKALNAQKKLKELNPDIAVEIMQIQLGSAEADASLAQVIQKQYADYRLENVVFCHGRVIPGIFLQTQLAVLENTINEHLISSVRLTHMLLQKMCVQKYGRFVYLSSMASHKINRGQATYALSKAALETFVKSLTSEYYHRNVTFNCVSPGVVRTPVTEKISDAMESDGRNRPIDPAEIGEVINFLCSEAAQSISGSTIRVEGGQAYMNNNLEHHKLSFYTKKT